MDIWLQTIVLALLQGLTEFLPISSSAHLILPSQLFGWPDQGLVFDVAVHLGTLLAVVSYYRRELALMLSDARKSVLQRRANAGASMLWYLLCATLPVGVTGVLFAGWIELNLRSLPVIAAATILFGLLLGVADRGGATDGKLNLRVAIWIGLAQVLALVPGTSRSGVTMMAGRLCGLERALAARFSFLLAIPVILGATCLQLYQLLNSAATVSWGQLVPGVVLSGAVAYVTIGWFLGLVERIGFWPFVIYRCLLGIVLLIIWVN